MTTIIIIASSSIGFILGLVIGICITDAYKSKKQCRACQRRLVEFGFDSDGKDYKCVEIENDVMESEGK